MFRVVRGLFRGWTVSLGMLGIWTFLGEILTQARLRYYETISLVLPAEFPQMQEGFSRRRK